VTNFRPGDLHRRAGKRIFKEAFKGGDYALHFASAREAFILVLAAIDDRGNETPHELIIYRVVERL
jgi:hypothetical protein